MNNELKNKLRELTKEILEDVICELPNMHEDELLELLGQLKNQYKVPNSKKAFSRQ